MLDTDTADSKESVRRISASPEFPLTYKVSVKKTDGMEDESKMKYTEEF